MNGSLKMYFVHTPEGLLEESSIVSTVYNYSRQKGSTAMAKITAFTSSDAIRIAKDKDYTQLREHTTPEDAVKYHAEMVDYYMSFNSKDHSLD